jgi:hypothetical protein
LLVDAKNDRAARWYESYGAHPKLDAPLSLVLPLATAADALKRGHYAVTLRGRPGLRVTLAGGGVPTTSLLALALSLLLATLAGSGAATSIVSALAGTTATGFMRDCASPMFFAIADRCAA